MRAIGVLILGAIVILIASNPHINFLWPHLDIVKFLPDSRSNLPLMMQAAGIGLATLSISFSVVLSSEKDTSTRQFILEHVIKSKFTLASYISVILVPIMYGSHFVASIVAITLWSAGAAFIIYEFTRIYAYLHDHEKFIDNRLANPKNIKNKYFTVLLNRYWESKSQDTAVSMRAEQKAFDYFINAINANLDKPEYRLKLRELMNSFMQNKNNRSIFLFEGENSALKQFARLYVKTKRLDDDDRATRYILQRQSQLIFTWAFNKIMGESENVLFLDFNDLMGEVGPDDQRLIIRLIANDFFNKLSSSENSYYIISDDFPDEWRINKENLSGDNGTIPGIWLREFHAWIYKHINDEINSYEDEEKIGDCISCLFPNSLGVVMYLAFMLRYHRYSDSRVESIINARWVNTYSDNTASFEYTDSANLIKQHLNFRNIRRDNAFELIPLVIPEFMNKEYVESLLKEAKATTTKDEYQKHKLEQIIELLEALV